MKTPMKLIILAAGAVAIAAIADQAFGGNLVTDGLDDPHIIAPAQAVVPCAVFTKRINHISGKMQRPDCEWKRPNRDPKRRVTKRPQPCRKFIEFNGGGTGWVKCDHVLQEGESE